MAVVYGFHPLRELLRSRPQSVCAVWTSGRPGGRRTEIEALCRRHRLPCRPTSDVRLRELAGAGGHNGFVAELRPEPASASSPSGDPELLVLVEDVQDPRNLGALLRVCEAAGVGRVHVRDRGAVPLTATVAKTSAGASEWLDVERVTSSAQLIERLKADGYWVYGAVEGGEPPWEVDLTGKILLCLGGEEGGLRERTRKLCDRHLGLPMKGRVASLNLATAAAALLYEAVRQRDGRA